jgi:GGDEF domain-containing protein
MSLRDLIAGGKSNPSDKKEQAIPNVERCLTLLVEGMALNVPEIDAGAYKAFRANLSRLSMQLPDRLPDNEKLELIRSILAEFESYRNLTETTLRERVTGWRGLVKTLFGELLTSLDMDAKSPAAAPLAQNIVNLATAEDIQNWSKNLEQLLHPHDAEGNALGLAALKTTNCSTANDNAAGLRGGGAAVEYVEKIMKRGGMGFVALFRLSCLEVIEKRFGPEAVQDCLMAVSAFLTSCLHSDDAIFHWSESSLLAILQGRANEQILTAELNRIVSQNRESSIQVEGRSIMLRIPLSFELTPISRLRTADDLYRLSTQQKSKW